MIMGETFIHHYSPERRDECGKAVRTVVFRQASDPYILCKKEVDGLYNKGRRLLATVETWLEYSVDEVITNETIQALHLSFNKVMATITEDVEELIKTHNVTNRIDLFELRDIVTQLQEHADDLFKPYMRL